MRRTYTRFAVLLFVLSFALGAVAQSAPPADLDNFVQRSMKTFDVPGLSIAIVKDGKVVVAKGYGVRKMGEPALVDANTLFGIASNTKAFTAGALGMLVDEGKLKWDDPVVKYLPGFAVKDAFITHELTVRDLLSHRSGLGLGAGDLMFWPDTNFSRTEVLTSARSIKPVSSLRSRYAYNNLMFIVAGEVIPAVTGKSWDDFIRERIFTPLGMTSSTITSTGFKAGDNVAYPHSRGWRLAGELKPIAMTRDDVWAAAAGIKSNATDLSKWMIAHLNDGAPLWKKSTHDQMWAATTIIPVREPSLAALKPTAPLFSAYGLGWSLRDYHGNKIVSHGGALTGMVSTVVMVPQQKLGIAVLTNQEETGAFTSIVYHILDHYLNLPQTDWIAGYKTAREDMLKKSADAEAKQAAGRAADSRPSLKLANYVGEYLDPWYGKAVIEEQKGKLTLRMTRTPSMVADLTHWQFDTFKAVFHDPTIPDAFLTFWLNPDGSIEQMRMVPTSDIADFSFDYQDLEFRPVPTKKSAVAD